MVAKRKKGRNPWYGDPEGHRKAALLGWRRRKGLEPRPEKRPRGTVSIQAEIDRLERLQMQSLSDATAAFKAKNATRGKALIKSANRYADRRVALEQKLAAGQAAPKRTKATAKYSSKELPGITPGNQYREAWIGGGPLSGYATGKKGRR